MNARVRTEFPRKVAGPRDVFIPLSNGLRLSARIWAPEDAEGTPVPAVLEYIPYRKRDATYLRDAETHHYIAGHGYASVRVDLRGSGDSEGVLLGEYLESEQDDACEVIAWLAAQPWCSGRVGMIGLSWGGINALQVAARRPPALKAIISICSSDDRYADDIHMMDGCLLTEKFCAGARMLPIYMSPPDPEVVGERWRDMWFDRLENSGLWVADWHEHQRRDAFYKKTSICEDYDAIECATYLVGGWADPFSPAIFRMLANLRCPKKALVGPWAHVYPHYGRPGPAIGFLQECIRWWDCWLKCWQTDILEEPGYRFWMGEAVRPDASHQEQSGRWIAERSWPLPDSERQMMYLAPGKLLGEREVSTAEVAIRSPQSTGQTMGSWYPICLAPDLPGDQRHELGQAVTFDSDVLTAPLEMLGAAVFHLSLIPDSKNAFVAVVLSEVFPDGAATLITRGFLNLTHREGNEHPSHLQAGNRYCVDVRLKEVAYRFSRGNRIRLALSTSFWPTIWPSPQPATLQLKLADSCLELPLRPPREGDEEHPPFCAPEIAEGEGYDEIAAPRSEWTVTRDLASGRVTHRRLSDSGVKRLEDGWEFGSVVDTTFTILPDEPLSARIQIDQVKTFARGDWRVRLESTAEMAATQAAFLIQANLDCFEGDERVYSKNWEREISRDHL